MDTQKKAIALQAISRLLDTPEVSGIIRQPYGGAGCGLAFFRSV